MKRYPSQRYPSQRSQWSITVLSKDGARVVFHAQCEDRKEVQALATEARHKSLGLQIWIREPGSSEAYSWD